MSVTMEQNAKTYERVEVKAEDLKIGDLTILTRTEITKVDVKVKFVYTTTSGGADGRSEIGTTMAVWRETQESKDVRIEAEYRARRNKQIREWFGIYQERSRTKAVQAKINDQLSRDGGLVDDWTVSQLLTAQAEDKVSARVHRAIQVFDEKTAEGTHHPAADLVGVVELVAERFRDELISGMRGLSRSTSTIHNAMEDGDRAAQAEFLDRGAFGTWFR